MSERVYLEDVGTVISSGDGVEVYQVDNLSQHAMFQGRDLPPKMFAVDFPALGVGQQLLLGRHLCGSRKRRMIQETGHTMMRRIKELGFLAPGKVAQFIILWGGHPYDLLTADPPLFSKLEMGEFIDTTTENVDTTYLKLTRHWDEQNKKWIVKETAFVGEWWQDKSWIIHEECIASGSTLAHFIKEGFDNYRPKKLFVFPVCGSLEGIERVYKVCREFNVELIAVFSTAIIQVAEKGVSLDWTDLGLQPLTITTRRFYQAAYGRYQGTALCWVGDIGDSIFKVKEYLLETICDMRKVGIDLGKEPWLRWPEIIRSREFQGALRDKDIVTYEPFMKAIGS